MNAKAAKPATVLEELVDELSVLAEWLKEGTERGTPGREFVNGLQRDLYVIEKSLPQGEAASDQAGWLSPFVEAALAKLQLGQQLFPKAKDRIEAATKRLREVQTRTGLLVYLRRKAGGLFKEGVLHPQARAYLERSHVLETLRSASLLRSKEGSGAPELALSARLLEGIGLHLALSEAADRPGKHDEAIRSLANRVEGYLTDQGAEASRPEEGSRATEAMRRVEGEDRISGLPKGAVVGVVVPGFSLGGATLSQPVVVTSPGVDLHLVPAVKQVLDAAPEGLQALLKPTLKTLERALYARLDDPEAGSREKSEAALDILQAMRPLVADDPAALGPLLEAFSEDFGGAQVEVVLPTPGTPMAPDPAVADVGVFSADVEPGTIVAVLYPGLKLGGEVVRKAMVQVSQGPPPPGALDEVIELLPDDDERGQHLKVRLQRARCLAAGDAGAAQARELADLALFMRDPALMDPAQKALRLVLEEPPMTLSSAPGWEAVREFLDEHVETLLEEGESGELSAYRLVRPYLQGLRTGEMAGARLRSLGESMDPLLNLFDEIMAEQARAWLFSELERLGGEGFQRGGHTQRLVRTAAKAIKNFYSNNELTAALELTQALQRSGLLVFPEDGEHLVACPDPEGLFHRLEAVYDDEARRGDVLGEFEPAVAAGSEGEQVARETGAISLSLGPEPATVAWLQSDDIRTSRLGPASSRLVKEIQRLDRGRLMGELRGDAAADRAFADGLAALVTSALSEAGWRRSDEDRQGLGRLFELLRDDFHLQILPGYLSYRRLRELTEAHAGQVKVDVVREGSRQITLDRIGALHRDDLLAPLDMTWCTGPPPPYVAHLRKVPWLDAVLSGQDPGLEMTPAAREAIVDFDSPDAQSLDGVVRSMQAIIEWLAADQPHELDGFTKVVKNAPGLEFTFFPLPAAVYATDRLLDAVERAKQPDALEVVRDAGREDGQAVQVERIGIYQKGRLLSEEPRARFALKSLPRACEALREAVQPLLESANVTAAVKGQLKGHLAKLALVDEGEGQTQVELLAFKTLLQARLVDTAYPSHPDNPLHRAGAYLAGRLEAQGLLSVVRFEGQKKVDEALAGQPDDAAEIEDAFCMVGSPELVDVKRPLVFLEGGVIQKALLLRGIPTSEAEVLEFDTVLLDSIDRLRLWEEGPAGLVANLLDNKQRQVLPRTIKRINDTRKKMFKNHEKQKPVLPPDTQRRDLIRFVIDQVHRYEDALAMLADQTYRNAFGDMVFKDVCFRVAGPYLTKQWSIAIDTAVVAGADTQALVGRFKKEQGGPKPKRENAKIFSVVLPCYSQEGVTIRPAVVRVGDYGVK